MSSDNGMAGLSEAEFELLADYTFGALDGAQERQVQTLVRQDRRWYEAHVALLAAGDPVTADLRSLADPTPADRMPADVVARLDAALEAESAPPRAVVLAFPTERARRRRMAMLVTGVAAAAVVAVGVPIVLHNVERATPGAANLGMGSDAGGPAARGSAGYGGGLVVLRSGTNYQPANLGQLADRRAAAPPASVAPQVPAPGASGANQSGDSAKNASGALADLYPAEQLQACLGAIGQSHPGEPVLVDYAYFQGAPALVVLLAQDAGRQTVVVVGPACGRAGADERYFATIA